ncbi:hypothetical protein K431DRAFT_327394 [Polychaeton citri CBS 116435]|uniref:Uncharacterized protein n=1 Tax=Polychaeton citri CBS 116435 TaxID=1314669 RepID=A0A9P4QJ01_9PEZI|nr:hypothetical protein K431DRAFT_327394 [Polychaeton citri CBS 116435]
MTEWAGIIPETFFSPPAAHHDHREPPILLLRQYDASSIMQRWGGGGALLGGLLCYLCCCQVRPLHFAYLISSAWRRVWAARRASIQSRPHYPPPATVPSEIARKGFPACEASANSTAPQLPEGVPGYNSPSEQLSDSGFPFPSLQKAPVSTSLSLCAKDMLPASVFLLELLL